MTPAYQTHIRAIFSGSTGLPKVAAQEKETPMEPLSNAGPLRALLAAAVLLAGALGFAAQAQPAAWPGKTVRLLVPFPAGSAPDVVARLVADRLTAQWGQTVYVDNKPGAGGIVGMADLVRSPADGYTVGFVPAAVAALTPHLFKQPQFDLDTQLVPVANVGLSPMMVVVPSSSNVRTLGELLAAGKAQPGAMVFAAAQTNSLPHLTGVMLGRTGGADFNVVPYSGSAAAGTAVMAGEAQFTVDGLPALTQHVKAGKLRALAVTSRERLPGFEPVPVAADTLPGFVSVGWFGLFVPTGTPAAIVDQINADLHKVVQQPALVARLAELGVYPQPGSPKAFADFLRAERAHWKKVVQDIGLQAQ
jgi:tripartite-type tricarboxylate transporter receptor subunit TctC